MTQPENSGTPQQWLTEKQVRQRLSISTNTIIAWERECGFPKAVRMGGKLKRWRLDDIRKWEDGQATGQPETMKPACPDPEPSQPATTGQ